MKEALDEQGRHKIYYDYKVYEKFHIYEETSSLIFYHIIFPPVKIDSTSQISQNWI